MSSTLGYPSRYIEALLRTVSPNKLDVQSVLSNLSSATAAVSAGPLDHLYARIGALNGPFFPAGWGNLSVVNYEEDLRHLIAGPPSNIKLSWRLLESGRRNGTDYLLYEGTFRTPCLQRVFDALPPESRTGRVQLLMPAHLQPFAPGSASEASSTASLQSHAFAAAASDTAAAAGPLDSAGSGVASGPRHRPPQWGDTGGRVADSPACVVHLAATGDQTFGRRLRLGFPLLKDNVCSLVLESPFYGARRPAAQRGSKLLRVSDLLTLGWATIAESVNLLHWLREEGFGALGMCGLSMGGVHASMTAGLFPGDVAVTPLLAPRSAAVAYCDGAMRAAMAWEPLLKEVDENNNRISQVVLAAGRAVRVEVPRTAVAGADGAAGATASVGLASASSSSSSASSSALGSGSGFGSGPGQCVALMREATYALVDLEIRAEKRHLAAAETADPYLDSGSLSGAGGSGDPGSGPRYAGSASVDAAAATAANAAAAGASIPVSAATAAEARGAIGGASGGGGGGVGGGGPGWSHGAALGLPFVSVMDLQSGLAREALRTGGSGDDGGGSSGGRGSDAALGRRRADECSGPFSGGIPPTSAERASVEARQPAGCPLSHHHHPHPHPQPAHAPAQASAPSGPAALAASPLPASGAAATAAAAASSAGGHRPHPPPHLPDMPFPHHHPRPADAAPAAYASAGGDPGADSPGSPGSTGTPLGRRLLGDLGRAVKALRADDRRLDRPDTVLRLKQVLETYTDITRYPRPRRADAAVIVAARDDAYVSTESVRQLHRYWAGSELRMVSGGHVSAFLMHQEPFRAAIRDSLARVARPLPQQ